ncbi:hypothetical protein KOW79_013211 [Hemibagrus wyckioides]|uniref:Secreted protein n=1 Tax=Hemibagrus wyckioides TaxID=337641 RepID=A0A9D3SLE2_9TELE|nr:hypothetical protein KOW79_013211 [Hemibagrus wyckioides]
MALIRRCELLCVSFFLYATSSTELEYKPQRDSWLTGFEPISIDGAAVTPPCRVFWVESGPDETLKDRLKPVITIKTAKSSMKYITTSYTPKPSHSSKWLLGKFPSRSAASSLMEALQRHHLVQGWNFMPNQRQSDSSSSSSSEED